MTRVPEDSEKIGRGEKRRQVKMVAETGMMRLHSRNSCRALRLEGQEGQEGPAPVPGGGSKRPHPHLDLDFWPPDCGSITSGVLSPGLSCFVLLL